MRGSIIWIIPFKGFVFPRWGLCCSIYIFRSGGSVILNSASKFFWLAASTTNCCLKAPLKSFHSTRLTHSSKAVAYKKVPFKKFIIKLENNCFPHWNHLQISWTIDDIKFGTFAFQIQLLHDKIYKVRNICFSNTIGPRRQNIDVVTLRAGFLLHFDSHVSETPLKL